jgi:hypothetical protein
MGRPLSTTDLKAGGRRVRLQGFPAFATIPEGSDVTIALPDGRELSGHVNYSKPDPSVPGLHALAAGFPNANGGFTLYQNEKTGAIGGHVLLMDEEIAYDVKTQTDGQVLISEHWKADELCLDAPQPQVLPPEQQHLVAPVPAVGDTPPSLSSRPLASAVL